MNGIDIRILEMYFNDGMKEQEIAKSLGLSVLMVRGALEEFENPKNNKGDEHADLFT